MAARVRAECEAQGIRYELTDEQMDFIGAVVFSRPGQPLPNVEHLQQISGRDDRHQAD